MYRIVLSLTRDTYESAEELNKKIHQILEREGIYLDTSGIRIES